MGECLLADKNCAWEESSEQQSRAVGEDAVRGVNHSGAANMRQRTFSLLHSGHKLIFFFSARTVGQNYIKFNFLLLQAEVNHPPVSAVSL